MAKRIFLLTGATGNLGSSVLRELLSRGEQVCALVRNPGSVQLPEGVKVVQGDVSARDSLMEFFNQPFDAEVYVIHCASKVSLDPKVDPAMYETNVEGTKHMIEMCLIHRVKKFVYVSSTGVIPEKPMGIAMDEIDYCDPGLVKGYYSQTKAMATQMVMDAVVNDGLDASIVYPSGIFGPYDYGFGLITSQIVQMIKGRIPCGLKGTFNCADVRDLAAATVQCAFVGRNGAGYILANEVVSMADLFTAVAKASGCRPVKVILPETVGWIVAIMSEMFGAVTRKFVIFTRFTLYNLKRNNAYLSERAIKELGYRQRPFEETIKDEVEWLRDEGFLKE